VIRSWGLIWAWAGILPMVLP